MEEEEYMRQFSLTNNALQGVISKKHIHIVMTSHCDATLQLNVFFENLRQYQFKRFG